MRTFSSRCGRSRRHVLRKFPCVGGSRSLGAVFLGAVCESRRRTEISWSDADCGFLFWKQGGVPGQFRMSLGMRWYTAVGLHTAQGISDKLRELTGYDQGASAVHQALNVIQDALLQGTHAVMYFYRYVRALIAL